MEYYYSRIENNILRVCVLNGDEMRYGFFGGI